MANLPSMVHFQRCHRRQEGVIQLELSLGTNFIRFVHISQEGKVPKGHKESGAYILEHHKVCGTLRYPEKTWNRLGVRDSYRWNRPNQVIVGGQDRGVFPLSLGYLRLNEDGHTP